VSSLCSFKFNLYRYIQTETKPRSDDFYLRAVIGGALHVEII
jgi:hypothetical protein